MPILRGCATCGAPFKPRHARHRHCPLHEQHGNDHRSPTTRGRPSSSTERQRIRLAVLARDPLCQLRLPGCTGTSEVADHVIAAADGGAYTLENLRGACDHCNSVRGGQQTSALQHGPADRQSVPSSVGGRRHGAVVGPTRLA